MPAARKRDRPRQGVRLVPARRRDIRRPKPGVYGPVVIDFDSVEDLRVRNCFKRIPTTLDPPAAEVDALRDAGRTLVTKSAEFRRFLRDQGGEEEALSALSSAGRFCPERRTAQ